MFLPCLGLQFDYFLGFYGLMGAVRFSFVPGKNMMRGERKENVESVS